MGLTNFSPDKLRAEINPEGGFATNEKYQVEFSGLPTGIDPDSKTSRRLQFLCENVSIPTKSISASDKFIYGLNYQMPYRQTFAEASMNFYVTDGMKEKTFFDNWQNKIVDAKTGDLKFHNGYTCQIAIRKFSRTESTFNNPTYSITLFKAWPSIVAEIQLSHSGGAEVVRLPVTFQYKKWERSTVGRASGTHPAERY